MERRNDSLDLGVASSNNSEKQNLPIGGTVERSESADKIGIWTQAIFSRPLHQKWTSRQ
jgi:hypothetical protein